MCTSEELLAINSVRKLFFPIFGNFPTFQTQIPTSNLALAVVAESQFLTLVVSPIFTKSVSRRLVNLPVIDMESDSNRNVGRSDLSGELFRPSAPGN